MLDINTINLPSRLLGVLFYYYPDSKKFISLHDVLKQIEHIFYWQDVDFIHQQSQKLIKAIAAPELGYQYSVLFEGQGFMLAPPWGLVYLDKENLLMGESTLRYRDFLQHQQLRIDTGMNEPEDQFGLMLMAMALLIESNRLSEANQLIIEHLMPWTPRYLTLLSQSEISPFYQALSNIAKSFLDQLVSELNLTIPTYRLYK